MVRHYGVAVVGTGLGLVRACLLSLYGRERAPMSGGLKPPYAPLSRVRQQ
jgi:hypothetical protein